MNVSAEMARYAAEIAIMILAVATVGVNLWKERKKKRAEAARRQFRTVA